MAILVNCGGCGKQFRAKDQFRDRRLKCPNCKAGVVVTGPHVCGTDVFISHSTADKQVADAVCAAMESKNLRCWIAPRDIPAGASWGSAIIEGIEDSRTMLLVFSEQTNKSDQVLREVERAVAKKKPIVPLRLDATPMRKDYEYFLASCHWLDATGGALEDHLATLTHTVRHLLLDRAEADADGRAPIAGAADLTPAAPVRVVPVPSPAPPTGGPTRRRRMALAIAALAVFAALAGLFAYVVRRDPPGSTSSAGDAGQLAQTAPADTRPAVDAAAIDLLARVNLTEDVLGGIWKRESDGALHVSGPAPGRLRFGPPPGGDYDLHVTFTPLVGDDAVGVIGSRYGYNFVFAMGGRGTAYGFRRGDGSPRPGGNERVGPLRNDVRHTTVLKVRKGSVVAIVDGIRMREIRTDFKELELPQGWGIGRNSLGIVTFRSAIIHEARCVPVAGASDEE